MKVSSLTTRNRTGSRYSTRSQSIHNYLLLKDLTLLKPNQDYVAIRMDEKVERQSQGGIIMPETTAPVPTRGVVIAVGPGWPLNAIDDTFMRDGTKYTVRVYKETGFSVGDIVLVPRFEGCEIEVEDHDIKFLRAHEIIATVGKAKV